MDLNNKINEVNENDEINGKFTYDDKVFFASYRFGNKLISRGYDKCLRIYYGYDLKEKKKISGYNYFGDDKYEIKEVEDLNNNELRMHLGIGLMSKELNSPICCLLTFTKCIIPFEFAHSLPLPANYKFPYITNSGEIYGKFQYNDKIIYAGYRYGDPVHQRGFNKCLKLYCGYDLVNKIKISGYSYFGDDKYGIKKIEEINENELKIELMYSLYDKEYKYNAVNTIIFKKCELPIEFTHTCDLPLNYELPIK